MHADIHLQLHGLHAAELHRQAAATRSRTPLHAPAPTPALRVQLGWKLVEFGLRLATPGPTATTRFTTAT
ncbi:hypothetical protein ACFVZH_34030 [Streptomyces sp. NPDC059534]|uniref:hypothetical protein n=1 Tax=Streptomyces sp. NPDC059534 TaxID=3346859 RepID=UPI0036873FAE